MKCRVQNYLIPILKISVLTLVILVGILILDNKNIVNAQTTYGDSTTQSLADRPEDPYYKYKYAYLNNDTSSLSGNELKFFKNLKQCLDSASKNKLLYKKEKAVYDWIILNCEYDYDNYVNDTIPTSSYYPEGVFIHKKGVCNGYALSFQLCMDILGIECKTITGKQIPSNEGHAWNAVKLDDGKWYQVDTTWGDPVPDQKDKVDYKYYNLTDAQMKKSHYYTCSVTSNGTKYSYWNTYGKDVKHITTQNQFYNVVVNAIKSNKASVSIALDYSLRNTAMNDYYSVYKKTGILADFERKSTDNTVKNGCIYYDLVIHYDTTAGIVSNTSEFKEAILNAYNKKLTYFKIYVADSFFIADNYGINVINSYDLKLTAVRVNNSRLNDSNIYELGLTFEYMSDDTLTNQDAVIQKIGELLPQHTSGMIDTYILTMVQPKGIQGLNTGKIKTELVRAIKTAYGITEFNVYVNRNHNHTLEIKLMLYE